MTARKIAKTPQQEADELRELIREAHGVLKDLRDEEKAARLMVRSLVIGVIMEEVSDATATMHRVINEAMDINVKSVNDEFERVLQKCIDHTFIGSISLDDLLVAHKVVTTILDGAREKGIMDFDVQVTNHPKPDTNISDVPAVLKNAAKSAFERQAITLKIPKREDLEPEKNDG